jgi:hypothetical protein
VFLLRSEAKAPTMCPPVVRRLKSVWKRSTCTRLSVIGVLGLESRFPVTRPVPGAPSWGSGTTPIGAEYTPPLANWVKALVPSPWLEMSRAHRCTPPVFCTHGSYWPFAPYG